MRPKGSALQLEAKRQLAIDLHRSGKTIQEMETTLGVTRRSPVPMCIICPLLAFPACKEIRASARRSPETERYNQK